jgi:hypothetical protein
MILQDMIEFCCQQWNENHGYCGESSMIIASLYYGQYLSQYDIRDIAAGYDPTSNPQIDGEFLLGRNDQYTASQLKLNFTTWDNNIRTTSAFLLWIKKKVHEGNIVTIGVYTNEYLFYCDTSHKAGDPDYDHIVTVVGVDSLYNNDGNYYGSDILYFTDHALWDPSSSTGPRYIFNYTFDGMRRDRKGANSKHAGVYSLPDDTTIGNYGLAISGIADNDGTMVPVRVQASQNYEDPEIIEGSNVRPASTNVALTITIANLERNTIYFLYKYNDEQHVPTENFEASTHAVATWNVSCSDADICTAVVYDNIQSSDKAIFRAVKSS